VGSMRNEKRLQWLEEFSGKLKNSSIKVFIVWPDGRVFHDGKMISQEEYNAMTHDVVVIQVNYTKPNIYERGNSDVY